MKAVAAVLMLSIGPGVGGQGCSPTSEPVAALVDVGDITIDAAALRQYVGRLPDHLRSPHSGEAEVRDLLQGLVDRQIMVFEAIELGYFDATPVQHQLRRSVVDWLTEQLIQVAINDTVQVSPADVENAYRREGWNRRVWLAHIEVADEHRAREVVDRLGAGADFAEVARTHSSARDAAAGGDLGRYLGIADLPPALSEVVLGLDVGGVSAAIRTSRGFEIVKVLAAAAVDLEEVREPLRRSLRRRSISGSLEQFLRQLEGRFGITYDGAVIAAIQTAARDGDAAPFGPPAPVLAVRGDGVLLRADVGLRLLRSGALGRDAIADSSSFVAALRSRVLADTLLVWEASDRGLDRTPAFADFRRRRHEKLAVTELRRAEVIERITIAEDEIRNRYQQDKAEFAVPPTTQITEILTDRLQLAHELRRRIEAGEDMIELARRYSTRPGAGEGHLHVSDAAAGQAADGLAEIREALRGGAVGELIGPLELADGGVALLRIEGRHGARTRSLESVRPVLVYKLKREKNAAAFERYIRALRQRYSSRVTWHDAAIAEFVLRPG